MSSLKYRPHHFMCTLGFQGKGYSPLFVENFQAIADELRGPQGDNVALEVTFETDSICAACPHQNGAVCGSDQSKITRLDKAHAKVLDIKAGDRLTWGDAKKRIKERIDDSNFDRICEGCEWRPLGVCLEALRSLRNED